MALDHSGIEGVEQQIAEGEVAVPFGDEGKWDLSNVGQ